MSLEANPETKSFLLHLPQSNCKDIPVAVTGFHWLQKNPARSIWEEPDSKANLKLA